MLEKLSKINDNIIQFKFYCRNQNQEKTAKKRLFFLSLTFNYSFQFACHDLKSMFPILP